MSKPQKNGLQNMALTSIIVSQLAGSILLGIFGGRYLDNLLNMSPLFLILGLLVGLSVGIYSTYTIVKKYL